MGSLNALNRLVTVFSVPILLLSILGLIIGGIWLAVLGKWGMVGYGIAFFISSHVLFHLALGPNVWLGARANAFLERGRRLGLLIFSFLSCLYSVVILAVWCIGVLFFFANQTDANSIIPRLLWSYGIASLPMTFLAMEDQERDGAGSEFCTFFAQVSYIASGLAVFIFNASIGDVAVVFGAVMAYYVIVLLRIHSELNGLSRIG